MSRYSRSLNCQANARQVTFSPSITFRLTKTCAQSEFATHGLVAWEAADLAEPALALAAGAQPAHGRCEANTSGANSGAKQSCHERSRSTSPGVNGNAG